MSPRLSHGAKSELESNEGCAQRVRMFLIRHQSKGTMCGGMVRTLIPEVLRVTVDVLHSKS